MTPLLSVLINTYNHEKYIEQAIQSVMEQDFPASDYEIVVVDDGSTDRTPEIVAKFAPRVRLLRKKNGGQASAFNFAFPELRGEIISLLDGDDWFAPGKLTAVTKALGQHPEAAAVGHAYREVHEETSEVILRAVQRPRLFGLESWEAARESVLGWRFLFTSTITIRRNALQRVIPIPECLVFCGEGPVAMAALAGSAYVLMDPLMNYRVHRNSFHAADATDPSRHRRMLEMIETTFQCMERTLLRLGATHEAVAALLYEDWIVRSRIRLRSYGGNRIDTFRTEMRAFRAGTRNPTAAYRVFKYGVVGTWALLLPPHLFYGAREWYGKKNLGRLRQQLARSG